MLHCQKKRYHTNASGLRVLPNNIGESVYTTPGTYQWLCPVGVTSVCVVCIGAGGTAYMSGGNYGGGGGGLGWKNNIPVIPGQLYIVVVGNYQMWGAGGDSWFIAESLVSGRGGTATVGGTYTGDGGGKGGDGGYSGGGAGGYLGAGGNAGQNGNGGGGGGGALNYNNGINSATYHGGGGSTGKYGIGSSGTVGNSGWSGNGNNGSWGVIANEPLNGGGNMSFGTLSTGGNGYGQIGAVRIIWGIGRSYPYNAA